MGDVSSSAIREAPDFVHLRTRSHFSLLSSPVRIAALVKAAVADGQRALALTDSGNLFGAIEFYRACKEAGIRPILGMTAFLAGVSSREKGGANNPTYELTLLAQNDAGWTNLKWLSSHGYLNGFYYRPRIDRDVLRAHSEGLIALSGGVRGTIESRILANDLQGAEREALELREILGPDGFYLELMSTGYEPQSKATDGLLKIHANTGIPIVATNDVHYLAAQDWVAQDIMLCIREGRILNDQKRYKMGSRQLFFKSREQMAGAFADHPDALRNTLAIAERCDVEIEFNVYHLPAFDPGSSETAEQVLRRTASEGAAHRYGTITPEIQERIDYELGVILKLGFASYFLITADFISHARSVGIPVGPGRGSAAGSIIAYCMQITDLDPLKYNLIFERFLNADRISMPDIDVDFCGNRRDEVIEYCRQKYGHENVSQIITFGTMASRGVLRDVGRVLEVPLGEIDKIAKKVPQGPGASLRNALEEDRELQEIRDQSTSNKRLFDLGLELEGLARHNSIHAAGVVISDRPVADYVPLAKSGDDVVTQWQMNELEEVGLLKVDFLGLKTLTILHEAKRLIREVHGIDLDLGEIPLDDSDTFDLMSRGDTLGVFQLESRGMREMLCKLKPDNFEDVIAALALYRPGPLGSGMVDMFVDRKHGREKVKYPHESLKPILEETYGVIVYQEQVMRIANVIPGFSMTEADSLRKAMGKKKPEVMAQFKIKFIEGGQSNGHSEQFSRGLFETIEYFAGYGFNKSHSAAYALLTFQTAYLKSHYPVETLSANLTIESGNTDKLKEFVDEAGRAGIRVNAPDVNRCKGYFDTRKGEVFYGFKAIKGVGQKISEAISEEREKNGDYKSLVDFCERHDPHLLNKTALDAMSKAGAFDCLGLSRKHCVDTMDRVMRSSAQSREDRRRGQGSLFGKPDGRQSSGNGKPTEHEEWAEGERLAMEKTALGFYLSGHPFEKIGGLLTKLAGHDSQSFGQADAEQKLRIAGMITGLRIIQIRSGRNEGKKMARFHLEDLAGSIEAICFARTYEKIANRLADDEIVFVKGRVDTRSEELAILVEDVAPSRSVIRREFDGIVVRLESERVDSKLLEGIAGVVKNHGGDSKLLFEVSQGEETFVVRTDRQFGVEATPELLEDLAQIAGAEKLSFTRR